MKTQKLLRLVRELTPTERTDEALMAWVEECENRVLTDVMLLSPREAVSLDPETDVELSVPKPYDKLYLPYVQAQVAYQQGEIGRYENYMATFETAMDEYARHILEWVGPNRGEARVDGYYLSAYGLAQESGYEGSLEEWLESLKGAPGEQGIQGERGPAGTSIPAEWAQLTDGVYVIEDAELPKIATGSREEWKGKGNQIVLIPMETNEAAPKLQINDGEIIEVRKRCSESMVEPLAAGELKQGIPYTLTFCGLYWLVDVAAISRGDVLGWITNALLDYATTGDVNAAIVNALTNYVTAQVLTDTLTEALADYATQAYVNGTALELAGKIENLTSDSIPMADGEYGFGGYNVTQAIEEVNSNIPKADTINKLIDAKLEHLPGGETDVQINGTSIVQGGVANIPLSGSLEYADGYLRVRQTAVENITQRVSTRALTLDKLDSAVKAALCDGAGAAWTAEEQAAARARLGILTTEGVTF